MAEITRRSNAQPRLPDWAPSLQALDTATLRGLHRQATDKLIVAALNRGSGCPPSADALEAAWRPWRDDLAAEGHRRGLALDIALETRCLT